MMSRFHQISQAVRGQDFAVVIVMVVLVVMLLLLANGGCPAAHPLREVLLALPRAASDALGGLRLDSEPAVETGGIEGDKQ